MPKNKTFFYVRPRYTPGSPALVDQKTAEKVAREEADAFNHAREGVYGAEEAFRARKLGLHRIAYTMTERKNGFDVVDLLTKERYRRPFVLKRLDAAEMWTETEGWVGVEILTTTTSQDPVVRVLRLGGPGVPRTPQEVSRDLLRRELIRPEEI